MRLFTALLKTRKLPIEFSNFPQRYIDRAMDQIEFKTPKGPQFQDKIIKRKTFTYTLDRPWTEDFHVTNMPGKYIEQDVVEPLKEWTMYRGDRVEILKGKDKGKQGVISYIVHQRNWVCVEGLNCKYGYTGGKLGLPKTMVKEEQPLLVTTEVALVDPGDNKPTLAEWRFNDEGEEVRVSVRTGRIIPMPLQAFETHDYSQKHLYPEQPKDTVAKEVKKITFKPRLLTFEQEIMEELGIKEDNVPPKTYWY